MDGGGNGLGISSGMNVFWEAGISFLEIVSLKVIVFYSLVFVMFFWVEMFSFVKKLFWVEKIFLAEKIFFVVEIYYAWYLICYLILKLFFFEEMVLFLMLFFFFLLLFASPHLFFVPLPFSFLLQIFSIFLLPV